jgi:hypothetical protein
VIRRYFPIDHQLYRRFSGRHREWREGLRAMFKVSRVLSTDE